MFILCWNVLFRSRKSISKFHISITWIVGYVCAGDDFRYVYRMLDKYRRERMELEYPGGTAKLQKEQIHDLYPD